MIFLYKLVLINNNMRIATIERETKETSIKLTLNLDGSGKVDIDAPIKFLNHMLDALARHSLFDLKIKAEGDTEVDDHHIVEDIGICLGKALDEALGDKKGISRMGHAIVPMDDSHSTVAVDLGGRPYAVIEMPYSEFKESTLGDLKKENIPHFLESFAMNGKLNLYVKVEGKNDHHKAECCFKALAKALYQATRIISRELPSTKEVI